MFNEICIYETKIEKQDEIEALMKEVAEFYLSQQGVLDVKYIKRTHRQKDFNAVKEGELPVKLTRQIGKVTYALYWALESEEVHAGLIVKSVDKTLFKYLHFIYLRSFKIYEQKNAFIATPLPL